MIINYQGTEYDFDQERITVDEWRELKRKYQMSPRQFQDAIDEADPDASTFLYWVLKRQGAGGFAEPLGDGLKPDILALNQALAAALQAEAERRAAAEPDPTPGDSLPDGKTPQPDGSSTTTWTGYATTTSQLSPVSSG